MGNPTLDKLLDSVRLRGAMLSRARYREPWAVSTRGSAQPIFHAIVEGRAMLARKGRPTVELRAGDVALLVHGDPHVMKSALDVAPVPIPTLSSPTDGAVSFIDYGGRGAVCRILCGTFRLDHDAGSWLLGLMPSFVHMRPSQKAVSKWIDGTLGLLDAEILLGERGSETVVTRLVEALVVQTLRHQDTGPEGLKGWLAAARDDRVGKALALIHGEPGARWSVPVLAARVGMSRSRFFERFVGLVGEPPARYLARWRTSAAADLIRRRDLSTAEAAERVGYGSEQAFTVAFRRHLGISPAEYRRRVRSELLAAS